MIDEIVEERDGNGTAGFSKKNAGDQEMERVGGQAFLYQAEGQRRERRKWNNRLGNATSRGFRR